MKTFPFSKDPNKNAHYIPFPSSKSSPGAVKVILTPDEGSMLLTAAALKSSIRPGGILFLLLPFLTLRSNKKKFQKSFPCKK